MKTRVILFACFLIKTMILYFVFHCYKHFIVNFALWLIGSIRLVYKSRPHLVTAVVTQMIS